MNEQTDADAEKVNGWPLPSPDVQRELEAPELVWSEPEQAATGWPTRPPGTG